MKIENKESAWNCGHKSTQRGNVAAMWRKAHKKARTVWKEAVFMRKYEDLVKRV